METDEPAGEGTASRVAPALPLPLTFVTLALTYWCVDVVSPALPAVRTALRLSATGAGLVVALFFAGRLVANLPASLLVDRHGPRATAIVGAVILLAGSTLAAVAAGESSLLLARVLQGGGVALLATAGLLSVLRALPKGGAAMTAFNVASGLGTTGGLLSGGFLTAAYGWRSIFWLCAILAVVLASGAVVSGVRTARARGGTAARAVAVPTRDRVPLTAALLANLLVYGNYSVWAVTLPLYAAGRFGAGSGEIGALLLFLNGVHLAGAFPAADVIRRWGGPGALTLGFALTAAGVASALLAPSIVWLAVPAALYAAGQVAGNSAAGDVLLRFGGGGGRAVGMVRLSSDVGLVLGPAAVGALADAAGIGTTFVALAAVAGVATVASLIVSLIVFRRRRLAAGS